MNTKARDTEAPTDATVERGQTQVVEATEPAPPATSSTGVSAFPADVRTIVLHARRGATVTIPYDAEREQRAARALSANRGKSGGKTAT
jgi:hypothetical protein